MANKHLTATGLGLALCMVVVAVALSALGLVLDGDGREHFGLSGFGTIALLPLDGLLLLTLLAYALALVVPHTRLVLGQSVTVALYGIAMIVAGLLLIIAGLARFAALTALLLAFPFGTIAYFVQYTCGAHPDADLARTVSVALGGHCFGGVQLVAIASTLLKLVALGVLLAASLKFAKVRGLLVLVTIVTLVAAAMTGLFWALSGLTFVMYPADAVLTALAGALILIYGIVTFVISLFGVALAIAGQVG